MQTEQSKKVSVIIPVFDIPDEMLIRCYESMKSQVLDDIEYIFVNDGSPRESNVEFLKSMSLQDHRMVFIDLSENSGVAVARNCAIDLSKGEFIGFVDADDWAEPEMFANLYNAAKIQEADIVMCSTRQYLADNSLREENGRSYSIEVKSIRDYIKVADFASLGCCDKIYRKKSLSDIRFLPNMTIYEDALFNFRVYSNINRFIKISEVLYNKDFRCDSVSNSVVGISKFAKILFSTKQFLILSGQTEKWSPLLSKYLFWETLRISILDRNVMAPLWGGLSPMYNEIFTEFMSSEILSERLNSRGRFVRALLHKYLKSSLSKFPKYNYYSLKLMSIYIREKSSSGSVIKALKSICRYR